MSRPTATDWTLELRKRKGAMPSVLKGASEELLKEMAATWEKEGYQVDIIPRVREMDDAEWAHSIVERLTDYYPGDSRLGALWTEAHEYLRAVKCL